MQISRRQHYLSAIGIDCWLPRRQLPGAASGPVYARKIERPPASLATHATSTVESTAASSAAARLQHELTAAVPKKTAAVQPRAVAQSAVGSFQLAFYTWAPELIIVDRIHDARLQQQLISNLLFALGHTNLQRKQPDYFQWPLPNGRQGLVLSPHEMVFGALQRLCEQHQPAHILLMGKLATQHVLGADDEEFVPGKLLDASPLYPGVSTLTTHSGAALLDNPLLKAQTWQHLQSLRV